MENMNQRIIVVSGATGRQGGAVARHLLNEGWGVRALTRRPESPEARALATLGADVRHADMNDPASLRPAFDGVYGMYSVQTPYAAGPKAEITQGKNLADIAKASGVQHVVYGSAGTGKRGTGVPSWETKLVIEDHMRGLGLPLTILRPMAFMELMTDKKFFPAVSTWHVMPALMGPSRPVYWLCVDDLGAIAAKAFARPDEFIGRDLHLATDTKSIDECRTIYEAMMGRRPAEFPIPPWLFVRFGFVGKDLSGMWRWLRTATLEVDPRVACSIHPDALSVEAWLRRQKA